jgi:hypothetical protein
MITAAMSQREICRRDEIHNQSEKRQKIRIDAGGRQNADDLVEQPLASGSYCARKGSHSFATTNPEFDFFCLPAKSYTRVAAHRKRVCQIGLNCLHAEPLSS